MLTNKKNLIFNFKMRFFLCAIQQEFSYHKPKQYNYYY